MFSGDLFGTTLNGVEDVFKMSYGYGEQNMVGFVANVFASTYLKATQRLTTTIEKKAKSILAAGNTIYFIYSVQNMYKAIIF